MKAIVQRAKRINFNNSEIDNGVIAYVFDVSNIENILSKVEKLKMWDDWKKSALDLQYTIFVVTPEKSNLEEIQRIKLHRNPVTSFLF